MKMLNMNSTRNYLWYVERMCLHTWNFGKISYNFIIYESGVGNRQDGLFTMNMDEHIHMWNHGIELYNTRSHLVADADVLHNKWWQIISFSFVYNMRPNPMHYLFSATIWTYCTIASSAKICSLSSKQYIISISHWRNHNVTVWRRHG